MTFSASILTLRFLIIHDSAHSWAYKAALDRVGSGACYFNVQNDELRGHFGDLLSPRDPENTANLHICPWKGLYRCNNGNIRSWRLDRSKNVGFIEFQRQKTHVQLQNNSVVFSQMTGWLLEIYPTQKRFVLVIISNPHISSLVSFSLTHLSR